MASFDAISSIQLGLRTAWIGKWHEPLELPQLDLSGWQTRFTISRYGLLRTHDKTAGRDRHAVGGNDLLDAYRLKINGTFQLDE
jgi:hypothetical protein